MSRLLKVAFVFVLAFALLAGTAVAAEKVFRAAIFEDPTTTNPFAALGPDSTVWNSYVSTDVYMYTLYGNSAPRWDFAPSVAADLPSPKVKEGQYWTSTVPLRKGLKWNDGTELTSEDVVFTYETLLKFDADKLGGNWASYAPKDVLAKVEAVDKYKVKFYLKKDAGLAYWQYGILTSPLIQKKHWEKVVNDALKSADPVKTLLSYENPKPESLGGFAFAKWEKGAFWENRAVPTYPDKGLTTTFYKNGALKIANPKLNYSWVGYGKAEGEKELELVDGPYVDSLIYRIYGNQNAAILALMNGDVDFIFNSLGLQRGYAEQLKKAKDVTVIENHTNGFRYLAFNTRREPMNIKEFRQAIATVIDRDFVTKNILQGVAFTLATVVPPGNAFWYNDKIKPFGEGMNQAQRVEAAVKLLKKAGFTWEVEPKIIDAAKNKYEPGEGIKMPDGKPMRKLEMMAPSPGYDPLRSTFALWIERWANDLGIPLKAKLTDFNVISSKAFDEHDFDMYMLGWSLSLYPDHLYYFFHSSQAGEGGFNAPGYNNPEYDKTAEAFMDATDLDQAQKLAFKLQEMLAEDVPYIVLFDTPIIEAYRSDRVKFPYTEILSGLQYVGATPSQLKLIK